ncbi:Exonuclease [Roseivivax lentus]|uniref:Exonuclease n=1 Tax=Roseivivax lentus TaxID=633194 RepID=A0A1N7KFE0_9RHOB|nr:exonuclease domain-containing protein [Roseivivax lentus]SIS60318.1 Exonuclease [Roseivivax lentus]
MFEDPVFIDFEASSLDDDSWPIEVGIAWLNDNGKVIVHSKLIKPKPEWPESAWSDKSAAVHGIARNELDDTEPAEHVARWLAHTVRHRPLISDAPKFDGMWLRRLASHQMWCEVHGLTEALWWSFASDGKLRPGRLAIANKFRAKQHSTHRAGEDAANLAYVWRKALLR